MESEYDRFSHLFPISIIQWIQKGYNEIKISSIRDIIIPVAKAQMHIFSWDERRRRSKLYYQSGSLVCNDWRWIVDF